jgi:hypothetical protein
MIGLLVKQPWIDLILRGVKTWELRGSRTKASGRIALIQSGTGTVVGAVISWRSRDRYPWRRCDGPPRDIGRQRPSSGTGCSIGGPRPGGFEGLAASLGLCPTSIRPAQ